MSLLTVSDHGGVLVVDSRLIAAKLGIAHKNFLATIEKYQTQIESAFGVLAFETDKPLEGSSGGRPVRFVLLTEPQATFVMTLSRNTDEVIQCKLELVQAFEKAKQLIPLQQVKLRELELENDNLRRKERLLDRREAITTLHPVHTAALILDAQVVEIKETVPITVVVDQQGRTISENDGVGITYIQKRYGFKSSKEAWAWVESVGLGKEQVWHEEMTAVPAYKFPRELLSELDKCWSQRKGNRQQLLGESA